MPVELADRLQVGLERPQAGEIGRKGNGGLRRGWRCQPGQHKERSGKGWAGNHEMPSSARTKMAGAVAAEISDPYIRLALWIVRAKLSGT